MRPLALFLAALVLPAPALACGVDPAANRDAIEKRWTASRPVPRPPADPWTSWRMALTWPRDVRACMANQKTLMWPCWDTLDCSIGMTSLGALCQAASGRAHAPGDSHVYWKDKTVRPCGRRIPQAFLDSLHAERFVGKEFADPGQGPGTGENYLLVQAEPGTFCLVHGSPRRPGRLSARDELVHFGLTDPALLALAWDQRPRSPVGIDPALWIGAILGLALALSSWRATSGRLVARIAVALAFAGAVPLIGAAIGIGPTALAGAPAGLLVGLLAFAVWSVPAVLWRMLSAVGRAVLRFRRGPVEPPVKVLPES